MKGLLGIVSLLVALALVGLVAVRQMKTAAVGSASSASAGIAGGALVPRITATRDVAAQSRQLQQQVGADVAKALSQGAARNQEADTP